MDKKIIASILNAIIPLNFYYLDIYYYYNMCGSNNN